MLRSGALPATLTYLEERDDRPDARRRLDPRPASSPRSSASLLVVVFMLIYYKLSGVNAVVALVFNLVILLGLMAYIGATMTLPGIAGFVLTMGIGVDSNVLIFERIKEELAAQRGVRAAINAGFSPRLPDAARHPRRVAHLRGVPVPVRHRPDSRLRHDADHRSAVEPVHVHLRVEDAVRDRAGATARRLRSASESRPCRSSKHPTIDFLRWRWHAIALSWLVILAGLVMICTKGLPLGIEFSGGTIVIVQFDQQPPDSSTVRAALERDLPGEGQNAVIQRYGDPKRSIRS